MHTHLLKLIKLTTLIINNNLQKNFSCLYPPQYRQLGLSGEETGWSFEKEHATEVLK